MIGILIAARRGSAGAAVADFDLWRAETLGAGDGATISSVENDKIDGTAMAQGGGDTPTVDTSSVAGLKQLQFFGAQHLQSDWAGLVKSVGFIIDTQQVGTVISRAGSGDDGWKVEIIEEAE